MSQNDYYQVLGVPRNATDDEIKTAYRNLALKCHPDRNPGDARSEDKFKEVNEAYQVLSDPDRRGAYDRFGHAGLGQGAGGFGGAGADFGDVFGSIFDDFFGEMTGRGRSRRSRKGDDVRAGVEITLEQAYSGANVQVEYERVKSCGACGGSGSQSAHGLKKCPACRGSGRVQFVQGFFSLTQPCQRCRGSGEIIDHPCPECAGSGSVAETGKLSVKVPPGIEDGSALRVAGAGDAGPRGAESGDLYVQVRIKDNPRFARDGGDLLYRLAVSFPQAALGCEIKIPTLDGSGAALSIPAGTRHGCVFRIAERGMPRLGSRRKGDLKVEVMLDVPHHLTARQKELLQELARTMEVDAGNDKGFFEKMFS